MRSAALNLALRLRGLSSRSAKEGVMTLLLINLRLAVCPQVHLGALGGQMQSFDS